MTIRGENPSPTVDFVFRKLFGSEENKDLLISLINSIVEPPLHLTDVVIKNPFNLAAYKESKETIVDIKARDQDGIWYDIEMQVLGHVLYGKRAIYYAAKVFTDQLGKGQDFSILNTTIGIHFLGFDFFDDPRMVHHFVLMDKDTKEEAEELEFLQFYFVELGKFSKDWPEINTLFERWVAFLTKGEGLNRESLPAALLEEPAIVKAVEQLERMGDDPEARELFDAEAMAKMANAAEIQWALEKDRKANAVLIQHAEERGMQRGQQHSLLRHMTRRFGEVPSSIAARIDTLTPMQLDRLDDALYNINSLDDVEAWLNRQQN